MPPELVGQLEFEHYHFIGFDLTQAILSGRNFSDCLFENCNLAGASIGNTSFQNVAFEGCKLIGLQFHACRDFLFGVHFDKCQLDYASFLGKAMPNTRFVGCSLKEVDFTQTDLSRAVFADCQLQGAIFEQTRLAGADFTTARQVLLDPGQNDLQQARFALSGLPGLLTKYELIIE
ncbi:Pentapeptide repeat-containing protein [Hymenobacter gelipurpurascens]|uniref:Pentapeptide repeat-containing protein n=1 Tax=Hymenobacter gelipurpurascens TaxID=89968 RepID=A0A212UFN7_9BACT|nr:pentapeptide repeat-containing protein [Hymenobacter gelipurpurascens]SNC77047.1 Pentapeptide repeat-containing protein [Hymenobacter gelipurpurascens]